MADENDRVKMAVIAGASHAVHYKELNPNATEAEILQHLASEMDLILNKIDKEIQ
jgi:hypothetical protein